TPDSAEAAEMEKGCLIFLNDCGLGGRISDHLKDQGWKVTTVTAGDRFEKLADRAYTINPVCRDDYDSLLRDLGASYGALNVILNLWGIMPFYRDVTTTLFSEEDWKLGYDSLLYLAQAVGRQNVTNPIRVLAVSSAAQEVTGEETLQPENALALGPCRVIPQEYPNITCRSIDVLSPQPGTPRNEALVRALATEVNAAGSELNVAYRGKHRWVEIFEPLRLEAEKAKNSLLREGGV